MATLLPHATCSFSFFVLLTVLCLSNTYGGLACIESEKQALLSFKIHLDDSVDSLDSWSDDASHNCCRWAGVRCSSNTGHVVGLDLSNMKLSGEISPDLQRLRHLRHFDIRDNDFAQQHIPKFLGSFKRLRYLDVSNSNFAGSVPRDIGNLSALVHLDLSGNMLLFEISLGLQNLQYLNLSNNNPFDLSINTYVTKPIPKSLGSFKQLRFLDLSVSGFAGVVPHELGNLSNLVYLSLGVLDSCFVDSAHWLSGLTSLQYLDMSVVNFSRVESWIHPLSALPSVREIYLRHCSLTTIPVHLPRANFTSLTHLDLSENAISSLLPEYLLRDKLEFIDLSSTKFSISRQITPPFGSSHIEGGVLEALQKLCNLRVLRLGSNIISTNIRELLDIFPGCIGNNLEELKLDSTGLIGSLPDGIGGLKNLRTLDLSKNSLHGPIPKSVGELVNLEDLSLGSNSFDGILSEVHLSNLTNLRVLDVSFNPSLGSDVDPNWQPPFQLQELYMRNTNIGPRFPLWLCTQKKLSILKMAQTIISDSIPDCFWNSSNHLKWLDLSNNKLSGELKPLISEQISYFDMSDNLLDGIIPDSFTAMIPTLEALHLYGNRIEGSIPSWLCSSTMLLVLDLSSNYLSGSIPNCWNNSNFEVLVFSNNNLSGEVPSNFSEYLRVLHLQKSNLHGSIPLSLRSCKELIILDLSFNNLNGTLPEWLGDSFPSLAILQLKSNKFDGTLPHRLADLNALQILDLSHNDLSGTVPRSFGKFKTMIFQNGLEHEVLTFFNEHMMMDIKGRQLLYDYKELQIMVSIDLSENRLSGTIPEEIGNLRALMSLNLSHNNLIGGIMESIHKLHQLESLDLSSNKLSGRIPSSLSSLSFLNHLNLSYNNLSGKIPFVGQLQTLDNPWIYIGNDDLCGQPLPKPCEGDAPSSHEKVKQNEMLWFYLGIAPGCIIGFWMFCGSLLLNQTWRFTFFKFIDDMYDTVYVAVVVNTARMKLKVAVVVNTAKMKLKVAT